MTSRHRLLVLPVIASLALVVTACGGDDEGKDSTGSKGPDRSTFVQITNEGVAAVVDEHLGDRVAGYYVFEEAPGAAAKERYVGVRLKDADRRDTFLVTVYPAGGSGGAVVPGTCAEGTQQDDPLATVTCSPTEGGGNVTITEFAMGFDDANRKGRYVTASGTGPKDREASISYESFTPEPPLSEKDLNALLGDPYLGWETAPKYNEAGQALQIATEE